MVLPVSLFCDDNTAAIDGQALNNSSPPAEKIRLFMSLFRGRDDVCARRWQNKAGKSGYSPVCWNEWTRGVCRKPTLNCTECSNKEYVALAPEVIDRHLRGRDVIGIYPLLDDETCYFLAIDFDGEGWQKDISVVRDICLEKKIPFAVERSRSGHGAHLWFFFREKVSAATARKFGSALLTEAMEKRHELRFKSYDRLFPNQDTLPKGGLGNLIALPLQLRARKNNNSVFIDEYFLPHQDQWRFLYGVSKLSESELHLFINELSSGNLLAAALKETLANVVTLTGGMSGKERKAAMEVLATTPGDSSVVVVATGKFAGEGFDEPRLDTLFLAMPVAWKGIVQQYAGRLHRLYDNKSEVQIYDYVDVHVGVLERMYHKRLSGYASIGYAVKNDSRPFESINAIFNNNNFLSVFQNDILSAKDEIVIVSPYIGKRRLPQMLTVMSAAISNGAKVSFVIRPESDYKEKDRPAVKEMAELVKKAGINLIFRENIHQKFAVIDQRVVWYGSINLLSFGSSEESIMRLESLNIANELAETILAAH